MGGGKDKHPQNGGHGMPQGSGQHYSNLPRGYPRQEYPPESASYPYGAYPPGQGGHAQAQDIPYFQGFPQQYPQGSGFTYNEGSQTAFDARRRANIAILQAQRTIDDILDGRVYDDIDIPLILDAGIPASINRRILHANQMRGMQRSMNRLHRIGL